MPQPGSHLDHLSSLNKTWDDYPHSILLLATYLRHRLSCGCNGTGRLREQARLALPLLRPGEPLSRGWIHHTLPKHDLPKVAERCVNPSSCGDFSTRLSAPAGWLFNDTTTMVYASINLATSSCHVLHYRCNRTACSVPLHACTQTDTPEVDCNWIVNRSFLCIDSVSSRSVWWHYLVVTVPDKVEYPEHSLLYITAGYNTDG